MNKKYDPFGQRVKKTSGTVISYFVYDESGHLLGEYDSNGARIREYTWLGELVVAMPLRHAGQYFDSEVGLFYNYFRDYMHQRKRE